MHKLMKSVVSTLLFSLTFPGQTFAKEVLDFRSEKSDTEHPNQESTRNPATTRHNLKESEEGLTLTQVKDTVRHHRDDIRRCRDKAMLINPKTAGTLFVNFTIDKTGSVVNKPSVVESSSLKNNSFSDCILEEVSSWKFPAPKGGITVTITYPFLMKY